MRSNDARSRLLAIATKPQRVRNLNLGPPEKYMRNGKCVPGARAARISGRAGSVGKETRGVQGRPTQMGRLLAWYGISVSRSAERPISMDWTLSRWV
jgi:hypothetical protein